MTDNYPPKPALNGMATALSNLAGAADEYRQDWETRDAALLGRIAELEKPTDPPTSGDLWTGLSRPDLAPAGTPTPDVVRTYLGVGDKPTTYTADSGMRRAIATANKAISLSWKDAPGQWLDLLLASMAGFRVYATQNHEPYNNFVNDPAEYHDRWDVAMDIMARYDHVIPTTILDGSRPESWETFWRADADVAGVDRYNYPIDKPSAYHAPDDLYGPFLDYAATRNARRVLIGETGSRLVAGTVEAEREEHYREVSGYLDDAGVEVACLWLGSPGFVAPASTLAAFLNG